MHLDRSMEALSMFDPVGDIAKFHEKFGLDYDGPPRKIDGELKNFRAEFLEEEVMEYQESQAQADEFDALIDLLYVAFGTLYLHGYPVEEGWRRVHEANMKKVRAKKESDSKRQSTYDVVKPVGWTAPDLRDLVG